MFLITGSKGQLGTELSKLLPNAILTDTSNLDITDFYAVEKVAKEYDIDTIINCAGYTNVDKAQDDTERAYNVNVNGAENLAKTNCKIIHISTDYVFDGKLHRPYKPDDETNPLSIYGETKLAGENAVLKNATSAVVIRTSWLYSSYGNNFVKTMLRLGAERESVGVVCDQIGTPTYAADLAKAILEILPQINEKNKGIYHFSNEGFCSWYDFAHKIMTLAGLNCKVNPILSSDYNSKAPRPFYSVLDKSKIKEIFNIKTSYWQESLKKCLKRIIQE